MEGASVFLPLFRSKLITRLEICNSSLGPRGFAVLAEALAANDTLQALTLSGCVGRADGTSALALALRTRNDRNMWQGLSRLSRRCLTTPR